MDFFNNWIRRVNKNMVGDYSVANGTGRENGNQDRTKDQAQDKEDYSNSTKLKSKKSDSDLPAETIKTPKEKRKDRMKRVWNFLPKRIVVAVMIFLSMSVYFLIYTSFNLLLLTMVETSKTNASKDLIHSDLGKRYSWDKLQQMQALNVFHVGEAISSIPSGILVEKKGSRLITAIGIALAGVMTFIIPYAARISLSFMCIWRLLQGFFCSEVLLGSHFLISRWGPRQEQCIFTWCILGSMVGSAFSDAITIAILTRYRDYHVVFFVIGSIAIAWGLIWAVMISNNPKKHPFISDKELAYISKTVDPVLESKFHFIVFEEVLYSKRFWALIVLNVTFEYGLFTIITIAPKFFEQNFHKMTVWQRFLPQICRLIFALICAVIMDLLAKRKIKYFSRTTYVKIFIFFSHFMPGLLLCLMHGVYSEFEKVYAIYTCCITCMGATVVTNLNLFHDMAPNHASQIAGYARMIGLTLAVFLRHICLKLRVEENSTEAWNIILFVAAGVYFFGFIFFMFLGSSKLQKWNFYRTSYQYYIFETLTSLGSENKQKTN